MTASVSFTVHLFCRIFPDGDVFVSHCPPLDIYSQGKTVEEARKRIIEASSLFLISCYERGTLERVLKKCGWKTAKPLSEIRKHEVVIPEDATPIDVPLPLLFQESQGAKCHA